MDYYIWHMIYIKRRHKLLICVHDLVNRGNNLVNCMCDLVCFSLSFAGLHIQATLIVSFLRATFFDRNKFIPVFLKSVLKCLVV